MANFIAARADQQSDRKIRTVLKVEEGRLVVKLDLMIDLLDIESQTRSRPLVEQSTGEG